LQKVILPSAVSGSGHQREWIGQRSEPQDGTDSWPLPGNVNGGFEWSPIMNRYFFDN
jgi:hypothetical protein